MDGTDSQGLPLSGLVLTRTAYPAAASDPPQMLRRGRLQEGPPDAFSNPQPARTERVHARQKFLYGTFVRCKRLYCHDPQGRRSSEWRIWTLDEASNRLARQSLERIAETLRVSICQFADPLIASSPQVDCSPDRTATIAELQKLVDQGIGPRDLIAQLLAILSTERA